MAGGPGINGKVIEEMIEKKMKKTESLYMF